MSFLVQSEIYSDEKLYKYLKENSYWYKYLNRSDSYLKDFKVFIKKKYKLGTLDRLESGINTINLIGDMFKNV